MPKAPRKNYRKGISLVQFVKTYSTEAKAEEWFVKQRWLNGVCCPFCGSLNVQTACKHAMPYRCREKACGRKRFSTKTRSVMEGSKLGYQTWLVAMFLVSTNLKGVSSMKPHRDLGITQESAWLLLHRLCDARQRDLPPVELDETYFGGERRSMSVSKRKALVRTGGRGKDKAEIVGAKDRATNRPLLPRLSISQGQLIQHI